MERRGGRILYTGVVARAKAHHITVCGIFGRLICEPKTHCSLCLFGVLFRGFYLGQARVPDFVTEKCVSLKRS